MEILKLWHEYLEARGFPIGYAEPTAFADFMWWLEEDREKYIKTKPCHPDCIFCKTPKERG